MAIVNDNNNSNIDSRDIHLLVLKLFSLLKLI